MSKAKVHKRNAGSARHRQGVKLEPKELRILKWCSGKSGRGQARGCLDEGPSRWPARRDSGTLRPAENHHHNQGPATIRTLKTRRIPIGPQVAYIRCEMKPGSDMPTKTATQLCVGRKLSRNLSNARLLVRWPKKSTTAPKNWRRCGTSPRQQSAICSGTNPAF